MLRSFFRYFESPEDNNPEFIRLVRSILLIVMLVNAGAVALTSGMLGPESRNTSAVLALSVTFFLELIALLQVARRSLTMAKLVVPTALVVAIAVVAIRGTGLHSVATLTFPLIIIVSTLLVREKAAYTTTPLVILAVVLIALADLLGVNTSPPAQSTGVEDIFLTGMLMYATSATLQLLIRRLNDSLKLAADGAQAGPMRQIIDSALDALITMDDQGVILTWNTRAEDVFGWRAAEAIGKTLAATIVPPAHREAHIRGLRHFLVTGEGPVLNKRTEITALHRDGHEFPVELSITPIRHEGKYTFSGFVRDITDRNSADLGLSSQREQKRARQFEAIAQVARTAASIQEMDELLRRVPRLIAEQFGYYHVGVYLLDANREYAVLQAANSEGGQRMLQLGHSVRAGEPGMVGAAAESGAVSIAVDVDLDPAFASNPDLPETRSQMALPMRVAGELIGILDIQSRAENAFSQVDIQVLSTLADLVAISIQNVRSAAITQQLLAESRRVSSGYIQNTWEALRSANKRVGYHFSATSMKQLDRPLDTPQISEALASHKIVASGGKKASLAVPILLRGQAIGAMELRAPQGHSWNADEIDIAQAVSERLSLAIETATVLEATQRRAALEQATSEMSSKISTSTRIESILRTTAEELSRALGGSDVLVQIQPPPMEISVEKP